MAGTDREVDDKKHGIRTDIKDVRWHGKPKGDGQKMTLTEKLMLTATLFGIDAVGNFEHLYTMPLLQTLGMPLSLVSLTAIVAPPSTILILSLIGYLIDRGSNPWKRKSIALVFAFGLTICGILSLLAANIMHLNYLLQYSTASGLNTTSFPIPRNGSAALSGTTRLLFRHSSDDPMRGNGCENETMLFKNLTNSTAEKGIDGRSTTQSLDVPFKAGLGMLGFILLDMGFDTSNAFAKTFVLACSPRSEHTSLLTIGLIMASAGGVSTATLGLVNFSSIFGVSDIEGGRLTVQTTIQAVVAMIFVIMCLSVTLLSGRKIKARTYKTDKDYPIANVDSKVPPHSLNSHHNSKHSGNLATVSVKINVRSSYGKDPDSFDRPNPTVPEERRSPLEGSEEEFVSDRTPLLFRREAMLLKSEEVNRSCSMSVSTLQDSILCEGTASYQHQTNSFKKDTSEDLTDVVATEDREQRRSCCRLGLKSRLAFITISVYFSTGQINLYTIATSDYVGKVIYGGDPAAALESESLARYQNAMSMASWGFFVHYGSYLLVSIVHTRVLAFLGFRAEFVLAQLLMAGACMLLAMTATLEAFFTQSVVAGFHRACFYLVPFSVLNDIVQDVSQSSGKSRVGLAMSAVSASIPLAYCTQYTWLGAVEEATGNVSIPLWLCTAFGCLSALSFLALGKV